MNVNPVISILVADRIAQLRHEADEERLAAMARTASNRDGSRQEGRRPRYVGAVRLWLSNALGAIARVVRPDRAVDCPDETPVEPTYSAPRWAWTPGRPTSPCP
jgi:hypothetical protein